MNDKISWTKLREQYGEPVSCADAEGEGQYCILGAVLKTLGVESASFPCEDAVVIVLHSRAGRELRVRERELVYQTIDCNDRGDFENGWECAKSLLKWLDLLEEG